jgi:hypothetical protein
MQKIVFSSVLFCALVVASLGIASLAGLLAGATAAQQPDWQIHSIWCTNDGGSSGIQYRRSCTQKDQFNSILDCQKHNPGAQAAIRAAGPAAVNSFMESRKPGTCKSAPPAPAADYYVIWRYPCSYANGQSAGDCTINQHSQVSCQDAKNVILRRAQSSDVCKQCANVTDNSKQVSGAVEHVTGGGPCVGQ